MNPRRGEVWLARLDSVQGSEQAGTRPVLVLQNDRINRFTTTILTAPFTTNLRRAALPTAISISHGEGDLTADSVLLCHQMRVLDKTRLRSRLGEIHPRTMFAVEAVVRFTLEIR